MKKALKFLNKFVTIFVIGLFIWYIRENPGFFDAILAAPLIPVVIVVIMKVLRTANSGLFIKRTVEAYDKKIPNIESFYIAMLSTLGNFFGPYLGGAGVRAVYLKKKYNLSYTKFGSTLSGFYIINFFVNSALGLLALFAIHAEFGQYSILIYLVFVGWLVSTLILAEVKNLNPLLSFTKKRARFMGRIVNRLNEIVLGWRMVRDNKKLFMSLNRLTVWGFLISMVMGYFEFVAIGVKPSIAALALYTSLSALSLLLSVTPGSIGIREAILLFSSGLMGLTNEQVIQISIIDRAVTFFLLFVMYIIFKVYKVYEKRTEK